MQLAMFDEDLHHDSHEYLMWLLNEMKDEIGKETWINEIFEG